MEVYLFLVCYKKSGFFDTIVGCYSDVFKTADAALEFQSEKINELEQCGFDIHFSKIEKTALKD